MSILSTRTIILAKVEAVYGTDIVPTPAANSILVEVPDNVIDRIIAMHVRTPSKPSLTQKTQVVGERHIGIDFSAEMKGSGTAVDTPPDWGELLKGCGFKETINGASDVTYATASKGGYDGAGSLSIYVYLDGLVHKVTGCVGNPEFVFGPEGNKGMANFHFEGLYSSYADEALPSPTYDATKPAPFLSAALTFHSIATPNFVIDQMTINMNNQLALRRDVNAANVIAEVQLIGREPTLTFEPEAILKATKDWEAIIEAGTEAALDVDLGSVAFNSLHFDADKCQIISLGYGAREGSRTTPMEVALNETSGDDELVIIHT